jgi:hypothetical protein
MQISDGCKEKSNLTKYIQARLSFFHTVIWNIGCSLDARI